MPIEEAVLELARWRRQGYGIWYVYLQIDGHDQEYCHVYPGKIKEKKVRRAAVRMCALDNGAKRKHVHITRCQKRDMA